MRFVVVFSRQLRKGFCTTHGSSGTVSDREGVEKAVAVLSSESRVQNQSWCAAPTWKG